MVPPEHQAGVLIINVNLAFFISRMLFCCVPCERFVGITFKFSEFVEVLRMICVLPVISYFGITEFGIALILE